MPPPSPPSLWTRLIAWLRSWFFSKELEVSIVGLQNAGKTSLVHALTGAPLHRHTVPTVGFTMRKIKVGGVEIKCWDLGGQPRFRPMWERYSRGVDVIVWVVDSADVDGLAVGRSDMTSLLSHSSLRQIPLLIVGNKSDLPPAASTSALRERFVPTDTDDSREIDVISTSCLTGDGINDVITWLGTRAH